MESAKALLIDLDGVIRRWDRNAHPASAIEVTFGLPPGAVAATAFAAELLEEAILGRIADEVWRQRVVDRLAAQYDRPTAAGAVAAWSAGSGVVDHDVLDLVRAVRARAPVCLVTNATTRLESDLERLGISGEFDAVVSSARVGARKPQPEIFHAALQAVDVPAERAFFIDDTRLHVEAATSLGLRGHVFLDAPRLTAALQADCAFPSLSVAGAARPCGAGERTPGGER